MNRRNRYERQIMIAINVLAWFAIAYAITEGVSMIR
jgi:hypothetical protein